MSQLVIDTCIFVHASCPETRPKCYDHSKELLEHVGDGPYVIVVDAARGGSKMVGEYWTKLDELAQDSFGRAWLARCFASGRFVSVALPGGKPEKVIRHLVGDTLDRRFARAAAESSLRLLATTDGEHFTLAIKRKLRERIALKVECAHYARRALLGSRLPKQRRCRGKK